MNVLVTAPMTAAVVCVALVPLARALAPRIGAMDQPGPLAAHTQPSARLGGLAIWAASAIVIAGAVALSEWRIEENSRWLAAALGVSLVFALGLLDDVRRLGALTKLGLGTVISVFVSAFGWALPVTGLIAVDVAISAAWLVFYMNAFNAFDGLDGLAAGTACISLTFLGAWFYAGNDIVTALCAWSIAGATLGFLIFNFPPARGVFLGDSGSLLLGMALGLLTLRAVNGSTDNSGGWILDLLPVMFVAMPALEAAFVIGRRLLSGLSPLHGDRRHLYDEVHRKLKSMRAVALTYYTATATLATVAWWLSAR